MLPHGLIYGSMGLGLLATVSMIATDKSQLDSMRNLFIGTEPLARFQRVYLPGFLAAMLADWLQGPFVYALYQGYGIDREHNGYLFVLGFGSSAIFGTFVGSAADKFGRKKFAILYCLIYFGHCLTKHMNYFSMLAVGRVLGGISTSLLFSVFDSWLVSESQSRGFDGGQLGATFSLAYFGSSIAAIAAGQLGEIAANLSPLTEAGGGVYYGGYVTPFDLSNVVLLICLFIVYTRWSENFGEQSGDSKGAFTKALAVVVGKKDVLLCGLIASSFESSMFIFVFNWTPCLMEEGVPTPPFGHIFSAFMVMALLGTRIFSFLGKTMSTEQIGLLIMSISAVAHMAIIMFSNVSIRFVAFLAFEACVGLYFPMIGTLKGKIVPENMRSTIYNIYRIPLNFIVLMPLLLNLGITTTFMVTTAILFIAGASAFALMTLPAKSEYEAVGQNVELGNIEATEYGNESGNLR